jgi:hypothetical protein
MTLVTNLSAYYKLENTSDEVGGNTLTNTGSVTFSTGKLGNGAVFPTLNTSSLGVNSSLGIDGGSCSFSMWIKNPTEFGSGLQSFLTNYSTVTDTGHGIEYDYNGGTRQVGFYRLKQGVSQDRFYATVTLGTGWNHLVLTYNGTTVIGYINGVAVGSVASSGNGTVNLTTSTYLYGAVTNGMVDDVGVWTRAITADEVSQIFNSGRGNAYPLTDTPSLYGGVAYYKLDEASGNASDSIGGNTGTNSNVTYGTGKINNGAIFAGTDNTVLGSNSRMQISPITLGTDFSINAWVKLPSSGNRASIFSNRDGSNLTPKWLYLNVSRTYIESEFSGGGGSGNYQDVQTATTILADGNFHLVTYTISSNTTLKMYIDGSLLSTTTVPNSTRDGGLTTFIGACHNGSLTTEWLYTNGTIDEVFICNRALSSTEVTALYNSGNGNQYPFNLSALVQSAFFNFF